MSYYKIRPRSGTANQWSTANPVLKEREIGFEVPNGGVGTGTVKMKMGDGITAWNDLPYAIPFFLSTADIVQNATTVSTTKVPSASVAKSLQDQITATNAKVALKGGYIGYASNTSLENAINTYLADMEPYVPYVIHGNGITGTPVVGSPTDMNIEVIILDKETSAYRIILYNNKGTDIHTICRIDGKWKEWVTLT